MGTTYSATAVTLLWETAWVRGTIVRYGSLGCCLRDVAERVLHLACLVV
jgi:hypothetical protein